jgi:predicted permease
MLRTLHNLYRADLGFSTGRVATFNWGWLPMPLPPYDQPAKRVATIDRALARLAEIPGVTQVGAASILPLSAASNSGPVYIESAPPAKAGEGPWGARAHTAPGLFAALDIPLLAGRNFDARDTLTSPKVAIVDASFARYFPRGEAIGQRFAYGNKPPADPADWFEVIGVVAVTRNPAAGSIRHQTYVSHTQIPGTQMIVAVRTSLPLAALMPSIRAAMREVEPEMPVYGEATLDAQFDGTIATQRLTSLLLGTFGALALMLAAVGLYGAINVHVGERRREMAVRLALGAAPQSIQRFVTGIGLRLTALGLALGLLGALGLTRLLTSVLYAVSPLDPLILVAATVLLAMVGVAAAWLPARRAARIDPMAALRYQ